MRALPNWTRICEKIVDGDSKVKKCRAVLVDELSEHLQGEDPEGPPSFLQKVLDGDPIAISIAVVPVAALVWYLYFYDRAPPQVATAT